MLGHASRRARRCTLALISLVFATSALWFCSAATANLPVAVRVDCAVAEAVDPQPGSTILDGNIGVVVPNPGFGVTGSSLEVNDADGDASGDDLSVSTEPNGEVRVAGCGDPEDEGPSARWSEAPVPTCPRAMQRSFLRR